MRKFYLKALALFVSTQLLFSCAYLFYDEDEEPNAPTIQQAVQQTDQKTKLPPVSVSAKNVQVVPPVKIVEAAPLKVDALTTKPSANVEAAHVEVEKQLAKIQGEKNEVTASHHATSVEHMATGVAPDIAMGWLKNGNTRFLKNRLRTDGQSLTDVKRLATEGQKPHTIVLTCSDSRVPPEILFDQKLGEIFVVRTAGEALDTAGIASTEYALSHLGVRNILVLGHTNCGAVKAACATLNSGGGNTDSESLNTLVKDIQSRLSAFKGKDFSANYLDEGWANTNGVAQDLPKRSGIIAWMLKQKNIQISTAIYDVDSGKVDFK